MSYRGELEIQRPMRAADPVPVEGAGKAPAAVPDPEADRGVVNLLAWLLVAALVLVQWGLFRQFALREVVWSYPTYRDQDTYLFESYIAYQDILDLGFGRGLKQAIGIWRPPSTRNTPGTVSLPVRPRERRDYLPGGDPQGAMLPLQATLLYCFAGPGRLTALSLNFFYFALLQIILVGTVRWLSGLWSMAFIALGLLFLAATPFFFAGGLFDFRLDFITFCLYGVFVCLVVRSALFADWRWSAAAGACGALLFMFRFFTVIYLGGLMAATVAFLWWRLRRSRPGGRPAAAMRLRNAWIACGIIALVALPVLAQRARSIKAYYFAGHITGPEKQMRAEEQGTEDEWSALWYYPRELAASHAGRDLLVWSGWVLAASAVAGLVRRRTYGCGVAPSKRSYIGWFVAASLLVPLAALTADPAKSPVVADVMVGPLVWAVLLLAIFLTDAYRGVAQPLWMRLGLAILAVILLARGTLAQVNHYVHRGPASRHSAEIASLLNLSDQIAKDCNEMGWTAPTFATDATSDALNFRVFEVLTFERHGQILDAWEELSESPMASAPAPPEAKLRFADFVVDIESSAPQSGTFEYPFDQSARKIRPQILAYCRRSMVELDRRHIGEPIDCDVTLFIRPTVQVTADADGWIASRGAKIVGLAEVLRRRPRIDLWGASTAQYLKVTPHVVARIAEVKVPAALTDEGDGYHLALHLDPAKLPNTGRVEINLSFDGSFVPRKINGSADDRELVMPLPDRASLLPEDDAALGQVVGG